MTFSLDFVAHSEIGLVRDNNQDSAFCSPSMLVVADGMGGAAAGDLASTVAINQLREVDQQLVQNAAAGEQLHGEDILEAMRDGLKQANENLAELVLQDRQLEGMGTTVCGGFFDGESIGIAHIGDSRGYLLRDGVLVQITHDHSWVQSLVDEGKISEEDAAVHPHRSLLLKVLNGQPTHEPDFKVIDLKLGDRLLFCSDGLSGMMDAKELDSLIRIKSLPRAVRELTSAAYRGGGADNITLVVADVVEQSDDLDKRSPITLGAAASVQVPKIELREPTGTLPAIPLPPPPDLEGVPADVDVPEGIIDPDAFEKIRYTPRLRTQKRQWLPWTIITIVVLALLAGCVFWIGKDYVKKNYFISATDSGKIGMYNGVDIQFLGHDFSDLIKTSKEEVKYLPSYQRKQVEDGDLRGYNLEDASAQLDELSELAKNCRVKLDGREPAPVTTPAPDASASPSSSASPSPAPELPEECK